MNKHFFAFACFILIVNTAFTQKKDRIENLPSFDKPIFHYGFYLGVNRNDYKLDYRPSTTTNNPEILVEPSIGFNVGLIADFKVHKNINIRFEPGLISNSKKIIFNHLSGGDNVRIREEVNSTFLHLPVVFKFSTDRLDNVRPYILAGISYDYNFSSNEKNGDDNSSGEFRLKTNNYMYEVGIGIDLYLYYFKFSPSIRGIFAINNEIKYDNIDPSQWTDPINYMGTRGVFLHLAFE